MNNNQNLNSLPTFPTQGMPATDAGTNSQTPNMIPSPVPSAIPTTVPSAIPTPASAPTMPAHTASSISSAPPMPDAVPNQETSGNKFINTSVSSPVPEATLAPVPENADNNKSNNTFINSAGPTDTSLPGQNAAVPAPAAVTPQPVEHSPYGESAIEGLNVKGNYNQLEKEPDYVNDPQVRENMNPTKKNTVTISKELKTVIIIAIVLLIFIFVIPTIFEFINKARFN